LAITKQTGSTGCIAVTSPGESERAVANLPDASR